MTRNRVALAALAADLAATVLLWGRLPERVAVHWDFAGEVDRWGSRWELLALGPPLLVGLWVLLALISRIDPKVAVPPDPEAPPAELGTRDAVGAVVLAMLAVLHILMLLQAAGLLAEGARLHALLIAGLMVLLGNLLGRVRPNFFVGIRTPWTLSDDRVWRRTHRLGGRLCFGGGLLAAVLCAVLPPRPALSSAVVLLLGTLLGPAVASYFWWRARRKPLIGGGLDAGHRNG